MSGSGDNLKLVGGIWNVRLSIPEDVRHAFDGKKEVRKSLKTGRKSEAQLLKQRHLSEWKTLIANTRRKSSDDNELQDEAINWVNQIQFQEMFKSLEEIKRGLLLDKEARKTAFMKSDGEEIQALAEIDQFRGALTSDDDETWGLLSELNKFDQTPVKTLRNSEALLEKIQNAVQFSTFKNYDVRDEERFEIENIVETPEKYIKNHPFAKKQFDLFHAYEVKRKVTLRSIDRHITRLTMYQEYIEKHKLEMDYESCRIFLESLTCADKTKLQYLCSFNAFYKFMFNDVDFRQKFPVNPFMNHAVNKVRRGARKEEVRKAFTKEQVKSLYSNAISKEKTRLADLIRLGAYTGARIEEICQIKIEDLVEVDGVYCIDIKQSKTNAGERLVPIHSELLPLVERLKSESKDGYLLKTNRGGKYGTKSKEMSSEFSAFKIALGYSKELVFHSFRHTMVTELERADTKNILVMSIVGHEVGGSLSMTFDRYSDGPTPTAKKEAIEKVKFDI